MFPVTSKPTPPTVFNLQALDWVHCKEETGAYYQLSWNTYKSVKKNTIFGIFVISVKNMRISKTAIKFIIIFFSKRDNWAYIYIYMY